MNAATRRHLELDTALDGDTRHTLLGVLDATVTPMGGTPAASLAAPALREPRSASFLRHDAVSTLIDSRAGDDVRERPPRRGRRGADPRAHRPAQRAPAALPVHAARCTAMLPSMREFLAPLDSPRLLVLHDALGEHDATAAHLGEAIVMHPPVLARDGGVFAEGYDGELDELRRLSTNADRSSSTSKHGNASRAAFRR